jgi:hypothetical protein
MRMKDKQTVLPTGNTAFSHYYISTSYVFLYVILLFPLFKIIPKEFTCLSCCILQTLALTPSIKILGRI